MYCVAVCRYIVAGGEDDLVCIYSWAERAVVAWGEGHRSWVSAVAFDRFWECPTTSGLGEPAPTTYRLVSIAQVRNVMTVLVKTCQPRHVKRDEHVNNNNNKRQRGARENRELENPPLQCVGSFTCCSQTSHVGSHV